MYLVLFKSFKKEFKTSSNSRPICLLSLVDIPCIFSDSKGISKSLAFIKQLESEIIFPLLSWSCQASCTQRGQLSVSVIGAFHFFGKPVVSVSKIKYI